MSGIRTGDHRHHTVFPHDRGGDNNDKETRVCRTRTVRSYFHSRRRSATDFTGFADHSASSGGVADARYAVSGHWDSGLGLDYAGNGRNRLVHAGRNHAGFDDTGLYDAERDCAELKHAGIDHSGFDAAECDNARFNHARLYDPKRDNAGLDYSGSDWNDGRRTRHAWLYRNVAARFADFAFVDDAFQPHVHATASDLRNAAAGSLAQLDSGDPPQGDPRVYPMVSEDAQMAP